MSEQPSAADPIGDPSAALNAPTATVEAPAQGNPGYVPPAVQQDWRDADEDPMDWLEDGLEDVAVPESTVVNLELTAEGCKLREVRLRGITRYDSVITLQIEIPRHAKVSTQSYGVDAGELVELTF